MGTRRFLACFKTGEDESVLAVAELSKQPQPGKSVRLPNDSKLLKGNSAVRGKTVRVVRQLPATSNWSGRTPGGPGGDDMSLNNVPVYIVTT
ncbi:MAG: hypothetical protein ACOZAO_05175 [Patescibacteria group bacterium]